MPSPWSGRSVCLFPPQETLTQILNMPISHFHVGYFFYFLIEQEPLKHGSDLDTKKACLGSEGRGRGRARVL